MSNEVLMSKINNKLILILLIVMNCNINCLSNSQSFRKNTFNNSNSLERIKLFKSSFINSLNKKNSNEIKESFLEKTIHKSKQVINQSPISKLIIKFFYISTS